MVFEDRCVLLLGKSGAGKSTIANQLAGYNPLSSDLPPFFVPERVLQASATHDVKNARIKFQHENIEYRVTVVDTVGIIQTKITGCDSVFSKVKEYFNSHIKRINLVLIVFRKGCMTAEEQEVFSVIRCGFDQDISSISALAVTHCENDDAEARTALVEEFVSDKATRQIAAQMKMGIYPVGFPPVKSMNPILQHVYLPQMEEDRSTLQNLIFRAEMQCLTKYLFK